MRRALVLAAVPLFVAACASAPTAVSVPEKLKPKGGEKLARIVPAEGVQIYECRAKADGSGAPDWAFVGPEADLFDGGRKKIGKHYAGPHWESNDGSKIVAKVSESAPAPEAGAIPWLLLASKSVGPRGSFSDVTSIQRVNTKGGVAPKGGCSQASIGTTSRVPYTADYYFLRAQ